MTVIEFGDHVEVQMLEDLVDFSLHKSNGLIGQINPSWCNSENEETDEDLNIDWPEEQGYRNHP